jgi:uncharacterized protein
VDVHAEVNVRSDLWGFTPLCYAVWNGHLEVKVLVEAHADLRVRDTYGRTPLELAKQRSHSKVVDFLRLEVVKGSHLNLVE